MLYKPHSYQSQAIDHILEHPRCALFIQMGGGKMSATLEAIIRRRLLDHSSVPVLYIAPKRVARQTLPTEIEKFNFDLTLSVVTGSAKQRRDALKVPADIYSINYENLPWLVEHFQYDWPFKTIVADESTRLKSFRLRGGGQRAKALAQVAHQFCEYFIALTGTPAPNGLIDLWGQLYFVDAGLRLGRTMTAFENRWFFKNQVGADAYATQLIPLSHAQKEIEDAISDVCFSFDPADHFDLDEPIVTNIEVELPARAMDAYLQMEKHMWAELESNPIEATNAAVCTLKCLQIASGAVYSDEHDRNIFTEIHNEKIQALESIVNEFGGAPILVAYHFVADADRLLKAFPQARLLDANPSTIEDWNAGKIPILLAHPQSAGHGLNLQHGGNVLVYFTNWWSLESHDQMAERIGPLRQKQSGLDRPVYVYNIVAKDTIDELVLERLRSKRSVQDLLLEAMKQKRKH